MHSSHDEAVSLLRKWKANGSAVILCFSNGPPDAPRSFLCTLKGIVRRISASWVEVATEGNICRLRLDLPDTRFEYVETRDPALAIDESDRELAGELFDGSLSVEWADEDFCVFTVLRDGGPPP